MATTPKRMGLILRTFYRLCFKLRIGWFFPDSPRTVIYEYTGRFRISDELVLNENDESDILLEYMRGFDQADTLEKFRAHTDKYKPFLFDSWNRITSMTEDEYGEFYFNHRLRQEYQIKLNVEHRDWQILMPAMLLQIMMECWKWKVPFLVIFGQLINARKLIFKEGFLRTTDTFTSRYLTAINYGIELNHLSYE